MTDTLDSNASDDLSNQLLGHFCVQIFTILWVIVCVGKMLSLFCETSMSILFIAAETIPAPFLLSLVIKITECFGLITKYDLCRLIL